MHHREDIDLATWTSIGFEQAHRLARREQARAAGDLWQALRERLARAWRRSASSVLRPCAG